jgi:hypothetical protein
VAKGFKWREKDLHLEEERKFRRTLTKGLRPAGGLSYFMDLAQARWSQSLSLRKTAAM